MIHLSSYHIVPVDYPPTYRAGGKKPKVIGRHEGDDDMSNPAAPTIINHG